MAQMDNDMSSKAAARRKKKAAQGQQSPQAATTPETTPTATSARETTRPTPERMALGKWIKPQGADKRSQPMVDTQSDMIGRLYEQGQLTASQEQSARTFHELWAAYRSELGVSEYRSCLAGGVGAHDESDGRPEVYAAWYGLCDKIGRVSVAAIKMHVERGADEKPINLPALKSALDRVAG